MGTLDIEQAARICGLSPREVRLLIEGGQLPATQRSGRWLVNERDLAATAGPAAHRDGASPAQSARPAEQERPPLAAVRPIGAAPAEPPHPVEESLSPLLARLEQAVVQIADLRSERDDLRLELREQVSSLQLSLEQSMEELDAARARVAELEAGRFERSVKDANTSARAALTPLFRATAPSTEKRSGQSSSRRDLT
jgi:DNA-binding transcriptional MerR regulator